MRKLTEARIENCRFNGIDNRIPSQEASLPGIDFMAATPEVFD